MRSGQVAAAAGVNPQTLRYYERRGLLPEPDRTLGGHRDYPADAVTAGMPAARIASPSSSIPSPTTTAKGST